MPIIDLSNKSDSSTTKLFFGDTDNIVRIDKITSQIAKRLKEDSEGNTWFSKEIEYSGDRVRFASIPAVAQRMFQLNIGYQTIMDSGASNGYLDILSRVCTDPQWKQVYRRIGIEETIHSESYSYALDQIFGERSTEFLDIIYTDPVVSRRLSTEVDAFADLQYYLDNPERDESKYAGYYESLQISLLKALVYTYLLEGIKFPFSFFVSFTINKSYNNAIQGIKNLLSLIAHDEFTFHLVTHLHVFKELKSNPVHGFSHFFTSGFFEKLMVSAVELTVEQELKWCDYLLKDGEIPGFNHSIGHHFIKYYANLRLQGVGLAPMFPDVKSNDIIKWFNDYKNLKNKVTAQQETSNTSYIKGGLTNDLGTDIWTIV